MLIVSICGVTVVPRAHLTGKSRRLKNPPMVRTDVAVQDVEAAGDHILARRGLTKLT
jgi:hypothetical protein